MALATYAELVDAITGWLNRSDISARVPDFLRLTEARLNRLLRDPDQMVATTLTIASGSGSLPADFGEMVAFGASGTRLSQVTPGEFGTYRSQAGEPKVYTLSAGKVSVLPSSSGAIPITYYRSIPALTASSPVNWLLTRAPDVYLYGALVAAEFYGWNDERLPLVKTAFDEAVIELIADGASRRWGAAPLAPRLGRT